MEELQAQAKMARLRLFGAEHPETLTIMGNIASIYRNLGAEHPDTLFNIENLTSTYREKGRRWRSWKSE